MDLTIEEGLGSSLNGVDNRSSSTLDSANKTLDGVTMQAEREETLKTAKLGLDRGKLRLEGVEVEAAIDVLDSARDSRLNLVQKVVDLVDETVNGGGQSGVARDGGSRDSASEGERSGNSSELHFERVTRLGL
jgi:hypothetical protein